MAPVCREFGISRVTGYKIFGRWLDGNFDPKLIAAVRVRRFDGADTWTFVDD